ncbi:MAG: hypothetical protein RLZZ126_29 [Pseudomonadota bacterium]|jgi:hypothetical protein
MWMKFLGVIAVATLALLAFAATRPDSFRVERSITINAQPEKIHAQINDFRNWAAWSPWEKMDSAMKKTFGGAAGGKGATYAWASDKVGHGSMEILESTAPGSVRLRLDFSKPFEAHNRVDFTVTPQGGAQQVTWAMYGPSNFMTKLIHVFMPMDKMVGKDFESGLRDLKATAEK